MFKSSLDGPSDVPRKERIAYWAAVNVQILVVILAAIALFRGIQPEYLLFLLLLQVFAIPYMVYNQRYLKRRKELEARVQLKGVNATARIVSAAPSGHSDYLDEYYDFEVMPLDEQSGQPENDIPQHPSSRRTQPTVQIRERMDTSDFEHFRQAGQISIRYIPGTREGTFQHPDPDNKRAE